MKTGFALLRLLGHRRLADVLLVAWATWFFQLLIFSQASPAETVRAMGTMGMFLGLYLALAVNLLACFVLELPRALARATPYAGLEAAFPPGGFEAVEREDWKDLAAAETHLRRRFYRVRKAEGRLTADRGRFASVFGPLFHLFLPLLLPTIVWSLSTRETLRLPVGEGETVTATEGVGPQEGITVTEITPIYLDEEIFFTHFSAKIALDGGEPRTITINDPISVSGGDLRLSSMGYLPGLELYQDEELLMRGMLKTGLFPPGTEAEVSLQGSPHRLFLTLYPDGERQTNAPPKNRTMELKNPLLMVRAVRGSLPVGGAVLGLGESMEIEGQKIVFSRAGLWVTLEWVKDPAGKLAMLLSLLALIFLGLKVFWPRNTWVVVQTEAGVQAARRVEAFAALLDPDSR